MKSASSRNLITGRYVFVASVTAGHQTLFLTKSGASDTAYVQIQGMCLYN